MKILPCVPTSVRKFYEKHRSPASPRATHVEAEIWRRFVTDARMVDFYECFSSDDEMVLFLLDSAAPLAEIDWQKVYGAREETSNLLTSIADLAERLFEKINALESTMARAALGGEDVVERRIKFILRSRRIIGRVEGSALEATAADFFSWNAIIAKATASRQYNRVTAFWRALSESLRFQHGFDRVPVERDIAAKGIAALCSCALDCSVTEEAIKKLRQRDNSEEE